MPAWPTSLPDYPLIQGYQESRQSGVVRTQMDTGPPKARRRFDATITEFQIKLRLTTSQISTLESFFEVDLDYGALRFDWTHPRTDNAVQFRFTGTYQVSVMANDLFEVTATLELLP